MASSSINLATSSSSSGWAMALFAAVPMALSAAYLYRSSYNKASFMYFLYARTPVGRLIHKSELAKARQRQQERPLVGFPPRPESHLNDSKKMAAYTYSTDKALVRIVPFLSDNYAYILMCKSTKACAVVDPADPEAVFQAIADLKHEVGSELSVKLILTTHYHQDHAGGNSDMVKLLKGLDSKGNIEVIGGANEKFPGVQGATRSVKHGDIVQLGNLEIKCLDVPCHTWGSVLFLVDKICFTGDYLFSAGCGRFFEGGAADFCSSLKKSVSSLADDVQIFPGHEYTVSNLKFAAKVLPSDPNIQKALESTIAQREAGLPTVPSSMGNERRINVFVRGGDPELLSEDLVSRVLEMVAEKSHLTMVSGSDKHDPATRLVTVNEPGNVVQIVRALRALKDRG